ncbi:MAG: GNAT family N-acetyltransferase [Eubacterium sp.]|mgnify:FL=1|nr:GNAT family N-acetyltransferase [Eubacterium sp.]
MIELRLYKSTDAQIIVKWLKNEYAFRQWSADRYESYPVTAEDMNNYYSQYSDKDLCKLTAVDENEIIGHLTIRFIDEKRKIARLGFVIVDDTKRGQGYGKQLVLSALKYAFDELKADKVTLGVFENNTPAIQCYLSCGFKIVERETAESYSCMNEIWNCIEMELNR